MKKSIRDIAFEVIFGKWGNDNKNMPKNIKIALRYVGK